MARLLSVNNALTLSFVAECFSCFSFQINGASWSTDLYENENCIIVFSSYLFEYLSFSVRYQQECVCVCVCVCVFEFMCLG